MTGGPRFWNEETQRWEAGVQGAAPAAPPQPPPVRPGFAPAPPPGPVRDPDAVPEPSDTGASWPLADPPSASGEPAASRGYGRRTVWTVVGTAAGVGLATALVLTLVTGGGDDPQEGKGGDPATAASAPTTPEPSPTPSLSGQSTAAPSPSIGGPPAGYTAHNDAQGFRIAVPEGWQRSSKPSQYGIEIVNYRSPEGDRRLQVYQVKEPSPDESFKKFLSPETSKADGFRKLSLDNLDTSDFTGSRLEYLADTLKEEPDIGTWHVVDERFVAADGLRYALASYGPDADGREDELEILTTALRWFCPPSRTCDATTGPG